MAIDYVTNEGLSDEDGLNARIMLTEGDPLTFKQADKSKKWRDAMMAEIESIEKNKTWELYLRLRKVLAPLTFVSKDNGLFFRIVEIVLP